MNRRSTLKAALAVTALTTISACATLTGGDDIVDVAASNGNFNTLVAAVQAAGLEDTLRSEGPFTVFAPTDDAFAALPAGTIEDLLLPENKDKLVGILTYHVIPGAVMAADVSGASTDVATVNGAMLTVDGTGDGVVVGGANVTAADIKASNGVIHVIDKVLLP
ncbi:fasciclin domain-containing protein [Roseobacter denitrificans]|nr:fasciclin domain-containing protein [Roseobacter denitrificans]AVL54804.1 fasciclin domain-containing protein [Roseobacter denitrificans]SFF95006.1 Uncaracterized surface protein containing fasciclin (FAS1) repeats [Roseobacter denitrificans OCh 114]